MLSFREDKGMNHHTIGTDYAQDKPHPFFSIDGHLLYSADSQACPATPHQEAYPEVTQWRPSDERDYRKTALLNDSRHIPHAFDGERGAVQV